MEHLLDLFNNGQYKAVYNKLIKHGAEQNKLLDQLLLSNNITVCRLLMRDTSDEQRHEDIDFMNILKKCHSISGTEQSLVVELTVLYNYIYSELVTRQPEKSSQCYSCVYKSCQRVLVCVSIGQKVKKSDVLNYDDMKAAVWSTIQSCLTLLQLHTVDPCLLRVFLKLAVILCVREIMNYNCAIVKQCLEGIITIVSKGYVKMKTSKSDILTLQLPLYVDHVLLRFESNEDLTNVSSLLLSVCLSAEGLWEDIAKLLETNDGGCVKTVSRFFQGFALYRCDKLTDSLSCLMEVLRCSDTMTQRLKARVCNLIGQCFLKLEKWQLSVQMFKEALCADFSFLLPLYNTSLQYRKQGMNNLELECLNLLVTALEMRNSSARKENREEMKNSLVMKETKVDVLRLIDTDDEDVHYEFVLYSLAQRTLQLERFDVASEKYIQLIQYLKSRKDYVKNSSTIPSLTQIHHEAVESLYGADKYAECINLCDQLLLCFHGNKNNNSVLLSQTFDQSYISQSQRNWNDSLTIEQSCTPVPLSQNKSNSQTGHQSGRKRKYSDVTESQKEDDNYVDVVALRYKAESLYKMGDHTSALTCLQRALDSITSCRRKRLHQCMNQISDSVCVEPCSKRQKTDPVLTARDTKDPSVLPRTAMKNNVVNILQGSIKSLEMEQILYEKTAEILTALKKSKDAQHFVRLAEQIKFVKQKQ